MLHNCIFSFRTKQWINKHLEQSVSLLFNNSTIYGNLLAGKFAINFFSRSLQAPNIDFLVKYFEERIRGSQLLLNFFGIRY